MRLTHPFQPSHHSSPHDTLRPALTPRRSAPEAWADVTTILPLRTTSQTHATMNSRTRQSAGGSSRRRADTRGPCRRASGCRGGSGRPDAHEPERAPLVSQRPPRSSHRPPSGVWRASRGARPRPGKQKVPATTTVMTGTARSRTPYGIRTRAAGVKGRCPRPLNEGGAATSGVAGPQRNTV